MSALPGPRVRIAPTVEVLVPRLARYLLRCARMAVRARGRFSLVLTGGSTPRPLYEYLATNARVAAAFPWSDTVVFWGDERHVPPTHADSNFRLAHETLLSRVPIAPAHIHRFPVELPDGDAAAAAYAAVVGRELADAAEGVFDFVLLGMGADGHIASLFPGSPLLRGATALASAPWVPALDTQRLTLTPAALLRTRSLVVLVTGAGKAATVREVLEGPLDLSRLPAQCLRAAHVPVTWCLDAAAARLLDSRLPPPARA